MPDKGIKRNFDYEKLESLLKLNLSCSDTAWLMGCEENYLTEMVKKKYDTTFQDLRQKMMGHTRSALFQSMLRSALKGNATLQMFLAKNLLGMKDKVDIDVGQKPQMTINRPNGETVILDVGGRSEDNS